MSELSEKLKENLIKMGFTSKEDHEVISLMVKGFQNSTAVTYTVGRLAFPESKIDYAKAIKAAAYVYLEILEGLNYGDDSKPSPRVG